MGYFVGGASWISPVMVFGSFIIFDSVRKLDVKGDLDG